MKRFNTGTLHLRGTQFIFSCSSLDHEEKLVESYNLYGALQYLGQQGWEIKLHCVCDPKQSYTGEFWILQKEV